MSRKRKTFTADFKAKCKLPLNFNTTIPLNLFPKAPLLSKPPF